MADPGHGTGAHSGTALDEPAEQLWHFACTVYARAGVREICLDWQERFDADVPLVIALCWQADRTRMLPDEVLLSRLRAELAPWRTGTVLPLRRLRRRLKPLCHAGGPVADMRTAVLEAELAAERVQLAYLAGLLPRVPGDAAPAKAVRRGLEHYLKELGAGPAERAREVERLTAAITARE
jgi:uncharacterized protein (TIGR02444 family)